MKIFNLNKVYNVVCNWENTRYGFRHLAVLHKNGFEVASYEFESVLLRIIEDNFIGKEKQKFLKQFKDKNI